MPLMNALRSALRNGRRLSQDLVGLSRVLRLSDTVRYGAAVAASLPQVVRSRKLVAADEKMRGRDFQLRVARAKVVLGGEDFGGIREMYGRSVYFAEPHCSFPSNGWAIDLGANAGLFTLAAACSGLRVVSVEAQPGFIPEIRRRLNRNNVAEDSVVILCGLVGPGSGVLAGEGWKSASHAGTTPPSALEIGAVMAPLAGDRVGLLRLQVGQLVRQRRVQGAPRSRRRLRREQAMPLGLLYGLGLLRQGLRRQHRLRLPRLQHARRSIGQRQVHGARRYTVSDGNLLDRHLPRHWHGCRAGRQVRCGSGRTVLGHGHGRTAS